MGMWKQALIFVILTASTQLPLRAENSLQQFIGGLDDYQFVCREENNAAESQKRGPFSREILEEAGFRSYSVWTLKRGGRPSADVQVYELIDPLGAFELFSLWPKLEPSFPREALALEALPVGNRFHPDQGLFWRGPYLFLVSPLQGRSLTQDEFTALVITLSEAIQAENLLPVTVSQMPKEGRREDSLEFYLGPAALAFNKRFPSPLLEEIGFIDQIEIAYASFGEGDADLFLIGYPNHALAKEYTVRLQNRLQSFFSSQGVYMKRSGLLICIFLGQERRAQEVLASVQYKPTVQWLYEKKPDRRGETITFFGLLTSTILGTGTFLLMIITSGLMLGFGRYEFIRRFPDLFRTDKMVRLDLNGHRSRTENRPPSGREPEE